MDPVKEIEQQMGGGSLKKIFVPEPEPESESNKSKRKTAPPKPEIDRDVRWKVSVYTSGDQSFYFYTHIFDEAVNWASAESRKNWLVMTYRNEEKEKGFTWIKSSEVTAIDVAREKNQGGYWQRC